MILLMSMHQGPGENNLDLVLVTILEICDESDACAVVVDGLDDDYSQSHFVLLGRYFSWSQNFRCCRHLQLGENGAIDYFVFSIVHHF